MCDSSTESFITLASDLREVVTAKFFRLGITLVVSEFKLFFLQRPVIILKDNAKKKERKRKTQPVCWGNSETLTWHVLSCIVPTALAVS